MPLLIAPEAGGTAMGQIVLRALASRTENAGLLTAKPASGSASSSPTAVVEPRSPLSRRPLAALGSNADVPSPVAKADGKGGLTLTDKRKGDKESSGWGMFFGRGKKPDAAPDAGRKENSPLRRRSGRASSPVPMRSLEAPAMGTPRGSGEKGLTVL